MSTVIMARCWPLQIPPSAKAVLMSLADNASDEGCCWPSIKSIAQRTCLKERAVQKWLKWLEQASIISRDFRYLRSTVYTITPPAQYTPGGCTTNTRGVHQDVFGGAPRAPRTIKEPSLEPSINPLAQNEAFARFWKSYPKKLSKGDAEKAFKSIKPNDELLEKILNAVARAKQTEQWQKNDGQFIPHPATWLRAKGWEDEHESKKADCSSLGTYK